MDKVFAVWLDEELIYRFKVFCAKNKISMVSVVKEAIEERLKNDTLSKTTKRTK